MDSGNQTNTPDRIAIIADILAQLKYDAVGMGLSDVHLGEPFFKAMSDKKIPIICAGQDSISTTVPYLVKNVNGVRVGIVSFGGIKPADVNGGEYSMRKAIYSAFRDARNASDVLILLDQANIASPDWIERNTKRLGCPDIVIGGVAATIIGMGKTVGNTTIGATAAQAKSVGVVDVEFTPGSAPKCTAQLIPLDEKVVPDDAIAKRVKEFMDGLNRISKAAVRPPAAPAPPVETGKPYYSSEQCKGCHLEQYEDWAASKHAKAVNDLAGVNRTIPECMTCHSERYRRTLDIGAANSEMRGVECATCHINSLPHGMEHSNVTKRVKVDPKSCLNCHTHEWSPDYDEKTYFPKVAHTGASAKVTAANSGK